MDAAVSVRKPSESNSYYAFTATPKAKTLISIMLSASLKLLGNSDVPQAGLQDADNLLDGCFLVFQRDR